MFIVILFILLGIALGYTLRKRITPSDNYRKVSSLTAKATTCLIWLLLFMLGIEVGSNNQIISVLPTLGVEALVLSSFATLGSCVLAWALWKTVKEGGKQ